MGDLIGNNSIYLMLERVRHGAFAETHRPASVTEISRVLNYPQSSTSVLLSALSDLGYLQYDAERRYRPTLRVMLLGGWLQDELIGEGSLLQRMERLRTQYQVSVLIGMRSGAHMRYILTLRQPGDSNDIRAGMTRSISRSAVERALLMGMTDRDVARILQRSNAEETDRSKRVTLVALRQDLKSYRQQGWAESSGMIVAGRNDLAMPLPQLQGHPPLAIGIGALSRYVDDNRRELIRALSDECVALANEQVENASAAFS